MRPCLITSALIYHLLQICVMLITYLITSLINLSFISLFFHLH